MFSQNRIRCAVAAVIVAMTLFAAGPAAAAGGSGNDLSRLLDRAWEWLAGWLAGAPEGDAAGSGGLKGIFENGEDGPHIDPNGGRSTAEPQPGDSQGGEGAGIDPAL